MTDRLTPADLDRIEADLREASTNGEHDRHASRAFADSADAIDAFDVIGEAAERAAAGKDVR